MAEVVEGKPASAFRMMARGGREVSLAAMKGKPFILYFYPRANTPGCTTEACGFQEALPALGKLGIEVIGVSPDKLPPIEKFAAKYGLAFPLASDPEHKTAEAYGVWVEKTLYGRKYMGLERATFLIGKNGKVAKVWRQVKVAGHVAEVAAAAAAL